MTPANSNIPISAIVVDDEVLARNLVSKLVRSDPDMILVGEYGNGADALDAIRAHAPEIVFLDIQMPAMDGLTLARKLSELPDPPYIVFVTAYDDYAIDAFELSALDYLVKPIQKSRFSETLFRAKHAIRRREMLDLTERLLALSRSRRLDDSGDSDSLCVRKGDALVHLDSADIVWIEAASQYVHVHTDNSSYTVSETLSTYANRIRDPRFFRVHRSAVVNGSAIVNIRRLRNGTHRLELRNGQKVAVARSRSALVPDLLRAARQTRVATSQ